MTKHVLHLVEWPARFKEPTPNLVSQVMKTRSRMLTFRQTV